MDKRKNKSTEFKDEERDARLVKKDKQRKYDNELEDLGFEDEDDLYYEVQKFLK